MHPVPGWAVTVPYGIKGPMWKACGVHTGVDIAAPAGTTIVAPIDGQIRHRSYGAAFGRHQFAISPDHHQPFGLGEVFFAHTRTRLPDGVYVRAGQPIAEVGNEGNTTGPHLHLEFMPRSKNVWACKLHADPRPVIDWSPPMSLAYHYSGKPKGTLFVGRKYVDLDQSEWDPPTKGLEHAMIYLNVTAPEFKAGQSMGGLRVRCVRADGDKTSYHDYPIAVAFSDGTSQLITHPYFELGDGGKTRYQLKCVGGLVGCTITTRYRKGAVLS